MIDSGYLEPVLQSEERLGVLSNTNAITKAKELTTGRELKLTGDQQAMLARRAKS